MDILQVLTIVLIVCASALCIALIFYLQRIVKSVQSINANILDLSSNLKPLIQSSIEFSNTLNKITTSANEQLYISKSIVSDFRDRADKILNFESKVRSGLEDTVMPFIKNLNAIGIGFESFWRNFKNK